MQLEGHCPSLQNVTALDVDNMRGRLWVLDAGTAICRPKVVVFDLRRNEEVRKVEIIFDFKVEILRVFQNKEIRICGRKGDEVTGAREKLH